MPKSPRRVKSNDAAGISRGTPQASGDQRTAHDGMTASTERPRKKGLLRVSVILRVTAANLIAHCAVRIEVKGFDSLKQVLPVSVFP